MEKECENNSNKPKRFYDDEDALEFIHKETHISRHKVRKMMNADLRYQKSVGIIDWDDLEEYIAYWTNKLKEDHSWIKRLF